MNLQYQPLYGRLWIILIYTYTQLILHIKLLYCTVVKNINNDKKNIYIFIIINNNDREIKTTEN